jgi:hypothetical protein
MYSVTMSSRTATDSGEGFELSPKAYMRSFTLVRLAGKLTYDLFGRGFVYVHYGDDGDGLPLLEMTDCTIPL